MEQACIRTSTTPIPPAASWRTPSAGTPDADPLFCRQIGLGWVRVLCADLDARVGAAARAAAPSRSRSADLERRAQSLPLAAHPAQPSGTRRGCRAYRTLIRSLGALGIPVAAYDFDPANICTTDRVAYHGYWVRAVDLDLFAMLYVFCVGNL